MTEDARPAFGEDGHEQGASVPKLRTGIPGFDDVTMGGLPERRTTVLVGQAGSAKTVFAGQFLAEGVRQGQGAVFVTLEEPAADLRLNLQTLGCDIAGWEAAGDWAFVDASPIVDLDSPDGPEILPINLETLAAQIGQAVDRTAAQRVVVDSLNAVLALHADPDTARQLLRVLVARLRAMGLTVLLTVETPGPPGIAIGSYGVEQFVADNVLLLQNRLEGPVRRRTVEVLKMRGAMHHKGEVAFTVLPGQGVVVLPMSRRHVAPSSSDARVTSGNPGLDAMTQGGLRAGSSTLVSGATGTGKTLLASEFIAAGAARGEQVLLLTYEESREQLQRNSRGWGHDLTGFEQAGLLRIVSRSPEAAGLDDHLVQIQDLVRRLRPSRVAIDSLSALERLGPAQSYREFVIALSAFLKQEGIATLFTAASPSLLGGTSITQGHVSAMTDAIVLLRYVELAGRIHRGIAVLKLRGSGHDSRIREFTITDRGMRVGEPFSDITGILSGNAVTIAPTVTTPSLLRGWLTRRLGG